MAKVLGQDSDGDAVGEPSGPGGSVAPDVKQVSLALHNFASCSDVQSYVAARLRSDAADFAAQQAEYRTGVYDDESAPQPAAVPVADSASTSSAKGAEGTFTNVQVQGIDEADSVKVGTDHLFTLRGRKIIVVDRQSLAELGQLDVGELSGITLYVDGDILAVIGAKGAAWGSSYLPQYYSEYYATGKTEVAFYRTSKGALPEEIRRLSIAASVRESRVLGGRLVLIAPTYLPFISSNGSSILDAPVTETDGQVANVRCTDIQIPHVEDSDYRLTTLHSIDLHNAEAPIKSTAVLGGGDGFYMTQNAIYIAKYSQTRRWSMPIRGQMAAEARRELDRLLITKIGYIAETGDLGAVAVGSVHGHVKDQWAFHQLPSGDALSVATTTNMAMTGELNFVSHNHLWVLRQVGKELRLIGAVNDFGPREDIRAVRYINEIAYVVTFEKTDPLFAIDLHDPENPAIRDELKIPGFSMYLHPLKNGKLAGVGYDADDQGDFSWFQGIQVSLFDISNSEDLRRLDVKVIGDRGSSSEVNGDHKAFYYDAEHDIIGVPVVELVRTNGDAPAGSSRPSANGGWEMGDQLQFRGTIIYHVGGDALQEIARLSHDEWIPNECGDGGAAWWQSTAASLDINRIFTIDGRLVTVSRFGIKAHDLGNPSQTIAATAFSGTTAADCGNNAYRE